MSSLWEIYEQGVPLIAALAQLAIATSVILIAISLRNLREQVDLVQMFHLRARAADYSMLLHILAERLDSIDQDHPERVHIEKAMDAISENRADHLSKWNTETGEWKGSPNG